MAKNSHEVTMLRTLNETQQSLLVQLKEIEGWLKDGCASTEEREALQQEREEIKQQVSVHLFFKHIDLTDVNFYFLN